MAVAPVNKFITVAVPVAPGEQKVYEVPTGVSSILLYAQVANVGVGTYPTATLIHRRESRSTGNTRDIRVIKDIEIPPNDAAILIDGRLVLEKTATTLDRLYIKANQTGLGTIFNVDYHEPAGLATITTMTAHGFSVGDGVTLAGIAFTCLGSTGITTSIFPDPQQSYTVDSIVDTVGTSRTFTAFIGGSLGYRHIYNPAIHFFVRATPGGITDNNAGIHTATNATYDGATGVSTITTLDNHNLTTSNTIVITDNSLTFTCTQDNNSTEHTYPRSTDPASGSNLAISAVTSNTLTVNVGVSTAGGRVAPLQLEFLASILENSTT